MTALAPEPVVKRSRPWGTSAGVSILGLLLGLGIVTAIGALAGTGRFAGEAPQTTALRVLRADQADVARAVARLDAAAREKDLRAAGENARLTSERLRTRGVTLALIEELYIAAKRAEVITLSATHMVPDPKLNLAREQVQVDFFRQHL